MTTPRRRGARGLAPATLKALALVDAGTMNPHAASRAAGISYVTIWRALKRRKELPGIKCTSANDPETAAQDIKNGGSNAE